MEENKDFLNWYKTKITGNLQDPPHDAWKNIADELDTNDVWDKIAARLDDRGGWFSQKPLYYVIPALLLLIMGSVFFTVNNNSTPSTVPGEEIAVAENKNDKVASDVEEQAPEEAAGVSATPDITSGHTVDKNGSHFKNKADHQDLSGDAAVVIRGNSNATKTGPNDKTNALEPAIGERRTENPQKSLPENDEPVHDSPDSPELQKRFMADSTETSAPSSRDPLVETHAVVAENIPGAFTNENKMQQRMRLSDRSTGVSNLFLSDSMLLARYTPLTFYADSIRKVGIQNEGVRPARLKTIEFGITASFKNTWLLNNTTFAGLERHTLTTTLPDFGKDIGMVFSYNFSPRLSAQAEGMFISEMGQKYHEYRNGKYVNHDVDLRYYAMNVLLKYGRHKMVLGKPLNAHAVSGGLFASRLKDASEVIGDRPIDTPFSNYNVGIILGYEYNRYLFSNLVFTSGLRLNYGLLDINPHHTSKTATGSFDVNVALKYRIELR